MAWLSDEEYIYRQDIKEKKAAGRGIYHKKNGSKSKKCTLPSDYMTRKEKMAMNGEVMSYNPNKFYSYAEFKQLPMEYQIKYVNSLLTRYNCSFTAIAKYVFQMSDVGLRGHFTRQNQLQYINMPAKSMGKALHAGNEKLREDIEKALWPNRDEEIQNDSKSGSFEITLVGGGSSCYGEPKEPTIQEKIKQAQDTVELYESKGIPMTPEQINKIYEDKVGMSFAAAMNCCEEPIGVVKSVEESNSGIKIAAELTESGKKFFDEHPENNDKPIDDSTDVQSFSIVMDRIDMDIIKYISDLFDGKKLSVSIEVKEVL